MERNPKLWTHHRKRGWILRKRVWARLSRIAEVSINRYTKRLPDWMEIEDVRQHITAMIPSMMELMRVDFVSKSPRMSNEEFYIFCRASFEVRRILSKNLRMTSELSDFGASHQGFDRVDIRDTLAHLLEDLAPTDKRILLLHYAGRSNKTIARYYGRDEQAIKNSIAQSKYDLGITPEEPHETIPLRRAA